MSIGYVVMPAAIAPVVAVEAANKLSAPTNITYTATSNSITLKWNNISGAEAYKVYKYNKTTKKLEKYKNVSGTSCKVTGLSANTTYIFKIAALDKSGSGYIEGEKSEQVNTKTSSTVPKAPSADYTGRVKSNGKTYYFKDGKIASGFVKISGECMYFDKSTYEMKTGWVTANGASYYFGSDGIMFSNGTYKIGGKTYVIGADGKVKIKSSSNSATATSKTRKFPSCGDYGFDADSKDVFAEDGITGYSFSGVFYDQEDAIDAVFAYRKALIDKGFSFSSYKEDRDVGEGVLNYYDKMIDENGKYVGLFMSRFNLEMGSNRVIVVIVHSIPDGWSV